MNVTLLNPLLKNALIDVSTQKCTLSELHVDLQNILLPRIFSIFPDHFIVNLTSYLAKTIDETGHFTVDFENKNSEDFKNLVINHRKNNQNIKNIASNPDMNPKIIEPKLEKQDIEDDSTDRKVMQIFNNLLTDLVTESNKNDGNSENGNNTNLRIIDEDEVENEEENESTNSKNLDNYTSSLPLPTLNYPTVQNNETTDGQPPPKKPKTLKSIRITKHMIHDSNLYDSLLNKVKREYSTINNSCPAPGCDYRAPRRDNMIRHFKSRHAYGSRDKDHKCPHCNYTCNRSDNLKKHINNKHMKITINLQDVINVKK